MNWSALAFIIGAAILLWLLYSQIRSHPEAFTRENFGKSFYTIGLLALALIVFIGLLVLLLRHS